MVGVHKNMFRLQSELKALKYISVYQAAWPVWGYENVCWNPEEKPACEKVTSSDCIPGWLTCPGCDMNHPFLFIELTLGLSGALPVMPPLYFHGMVHSHLSMWVCCQLEIEGHHEWAWCRPVGSCTACMHIRSCSQPHRWQNMAEFYAI